MFFHPLFIFVPGNRLCRSSTPQRLKTTSPVEANLFFKQQKSRRLCHMPSKCSNDFSLQFVALSKVLAISQLVPLMLALSLRVVHMCSRMGVSSWFDRVRIKWYKWLRNVRRMTNGHMPCPYLINHSFGSFGCSRCLATNWSNEATLDQTTKQHCLYTIELSESTQLRNLPIAIAVFPEEMVTVQLTTFELSK